LWKASRGLRGRESTGQEKTFVVGSMGQSAYRDRIPTAENEREKKPGGDLHARDGDRTRKGSYRSKVTFRLKMGRTL